MISGVRRSGGSSGKGGGLSPEGLKVFLPRTDLSNGENVGHHPHLMTSGRGEGSPSSRSVEEDPPVDEGLGTEKGGKGVRQNPDGNMIGLKSLEILGIPVCCGTGDENPEMNPVSSGDVQGIFKTIGFGEAKKNQIDLGSCPCDLVREKGPGERSPSDDPVTLGSHADSHAENCSDQSDDQEGMAIKGTMNIGCSAGRGRGKLEGRDPQVEEEDEKKPGRISKNGPVGKGKGGVCPDDPHETGRNEKGERCPEGVFWRGSGPASKDGQVKQAECQEEPHPESEIL